MKQIISEVSPETQIVLAKAIGAVAGSMISIAYIMPKGKREAAARFLTGLTAGLVFGLPVGVWVASKTGIIAYLTKLEVAIMGAALASLSIWTALGVALRLSNSFLMQGNRTEGKEPKDANDA